MSNRLTCRAFLRHLSAVRWRPTDHSPCQNKPPQFLGRYMFSTTRNSKLQGLPNAHVEAEPTPEPPSFATLSRAPDSAPRKFVPEIRVATLPRSDAGGVYLEIENAVHRFDNLFLRDSCNCELCRASTGQKRFQTSDIPQSIEAKAVQVGLGCVKVLWKSDAPGYTNHVSEYSSQWIAAQLKFGSRVGQPNRIQQWLSYASLRDKPQWHSFENLVSDPATLVQVLSDLHSSGIGLISRVPHSEDAVVRIGEKIGPLRDTFYGRTWDVKDQPQSKNVAYTASYLGLHMDLLYMNEPPGLQLLHCLRSSCDGGESMFADSFAAASALYRDSRSAYQILKEFPVSYFYHANGNDYKASRPTIVEDALGRVDEIGQPLIDHVNWSPPFQAQFQVDNGIDDSGERLRKYHIAAQEFATIVQDPYSQFRHRMEPGECIVFDNRRVLHGRQAFKADSGERWLRGAYVDSDAFRSKYRVLVEKR